MHTHEQFLFSVASVVEGNDHVVIKAHDCVHAQFRDSFVCAVNCNKQPLKSYTIKSLVIVLLNLHNTLIG